jgi:hypothetical protein
MHRCFALPPRPILPEQMRLVPWVIVHRNRKRPEFPLGTDLKKSCGPAVAEQDRFIRRSDQKTGADMDGHSVYFAFETHEHRGAVVLGGHPVAAVEGTERDDLAVAVVQPNVQAIAFADERRAAKDHARSR